ncbi:YcxB family protein [Methylobacterium sp. NEAU 140]|uniref:YcxB family protein n=1 Tax=Methylobacterium sp. NEAU 140 TaxID=3064945 RepID=UPI0027344B17|nr:YcxB family protein [Methylobacterium sp. NEAU 140]MDP4026896.1 YcxB family protein [Methylobacterium sp. NEAU 140]
MRLTDTPLNLQVQAPIVAAQRRRILTVGLPTLWFLALLGMVSAWATAGGRRSLSAFWRDLPSFDPLPLAAGLGVITLALLTHHALHPRLARRRMRTLMGPPSEDGRDPGPVPMRYRLDGAGLTQTAPDLASFVPWPRIRGLAEDRDHLFLMVEIGDVPIVLPKAQLGAEVVADIRSWVHACAGRPAPAPPPAEPVTGPEAVRATMRLTVEERVPIILRALENPLARRARLIATAAWFVGLSLLYPALLAMLWAIDPYRVPLADTLPLFAEMVATDFWKPSAIVAAVIGLVLAVHPRARRWFAGAAAHDLDAEAPAGEARIVIDGAGIVTAQDGAHARLGWNLFHGYERVGDLVILSMRWNDVLPVPLRIFKPEARTRFEALAERHLPMETRAR